MSQQTETSQPTRKKSKTEPGAVERATDLALDVAIGGTLLAADKAVDLAEKVIEGAGDAIRHGEEQVDRASRQARDQADELKQRAEGQVRDAKHRVEARLEEPDQRPYEERTKRELYALAADRDIASRSSMNKAELIAALRAAR